ncbi:hypothetical protein ACFY36_06140 [Actinoplanes sp. NPDC000266]
MTGWLPLYLRSRRLPAALAASVGAVLVVWAAWAAFSRDHEVGRGLTVLTVALALAPVIPTLAGHDDSLESTAALRWPPRRAVHLLACGALVTAALALFGVTSTTFGPFGQLARDTAGLTGLMGLSVALLGTRLAWAPPIGWTAVQILFGVPDGAAWHRALFWLVQDPSDRTAATTATLLLLTGVLAYALRPGPSVSPTETTMQQ